jgi:hypothetical protein
VFDGKPEAVGQARAGRAQRLANRAEWRERLVVPPAPAEADKLAARYVSPALGVLAVRKQDGATIFDFGKWYSAVASRKNDDGTTSFVTIDPTVDGFTFVVSERDGKKALVIRDAQHEYPLIEQP